MLSSPRTGSTVLGEILSKKFPKVQLFLEPDSYRKKLGAKDSMDGFTNYSNISNQYILKCHLINLNKYPPNLIEKVMNHDAYLIKITRRNIMDQMVSTYIEMVRKLWYYDMFTVKKYKDETIPIEGDMIETVVRIVKESNDSFNKIQINYDLEIYYEDLIKNINDTYKTRSSITPKPINHNEIYQAIEHHLLNSK
jgi:hypothetical protein